MVDSTTTPPPQEVAKASDCAPCSDTCATLGLGGVTSVVAGVWKHVSHTRFLGNMTDDSGKEGTDVKKTDLLLRTDIWDKFHPENTRRPSYKEPTSPVGDNSTVEIGVPYSQEEEMAGRLHAELERMKRAGSNATLASAA